MLVLSILKETRITSGWNRIKMQINWRCKKGSKNPLKSFTAFSKICERFLYMATGWNRSIILRISKDLRYRHSVHHFLINPSQCREADCMIFFIFKSEPFSTPIFYLLIHYSLQSYWQSENATQIPTKIKFRFLQDFFGRFLQPSPLLCPKI